MSAGPVADCVRLLTESARLEVSMSVAWCCGGRRDRGVSGGVGTMTIAVALHAAWVIVATFVP